MTECNKYPLNVLTSGIHLNINNSGKCLLINSLQIT